MEITDFTAIAVVGAVMSLLIKMIKARYGTTSNATKALTLGLAIAFGGVYVLINSTPYIETVGLVLSTASAVYAFFIKE